MSRQKQKGTRLETAVVDYMAWALGDHGIHRETLHGSMDVGDIGGVYLQGEPVTIEVKNTARLDLAAHYREAEIEAGNKDSLMPILVQKRFGTGIATMDGIGRQWAIMTLETLCRLLNHGLPIGDEAGDEEAV